MSLFKKIFGRKAKQEQPTSDTNTITDTGKHMPDIAIPVDEKFTINFKKNGGKFIYCTTMEEVYSSFSHILKENNWQPEHILCTKERLANSFTKFDLIWGLEHKNFPALLTTCEYLIADDGSILISSNQIQEKKLKELPETFIVFTTTSQLVASISEGMRGIKHRYHRNIPSNITTIKYFETQEEQDFMSYGSSAKNLYLLLLEDL